MRRVVCLLLALVLVGTVCVTSFSVRNMCFHSPGGATGPINPQEGLSWWEFFLLYQFAAYNSVHAALFYQGEADTLYDQAMAKGLDVSVVDDLLAKAYALLAEAQACFEKGDYRCAGRKALDAVYLYLQAISELDALLG